MLRWLSIWRRRNRVWRSYRVASLLLRTLWIVNRERSRVVRARAAGEYGVRPNIEALLRILREFRRTAVDLGGLVIKLGQFLGARADLLPPEALLELAALQDEVPAERFEDVQALLECELQAPLASVFQHVEPMPAGSASLGQVHRAQLHDGRSVAVKVQRPGIEAIVRSDLATLRFVLRVVRTFAPSAERFIDLRALYREFSRTIYEELDYQREGRSAEQFARIFTEDANIGVPGVIWEHSTNRVLTLDWVDGIKVSQIEALDAAGVDRDALAKRLARAYFTQVLDAGFFHADPHPGNLLVQPLAPSAGGTAGAARIVFVDFGMMGVITPQLRNALRDCFAGFVQQDATLMVDALDALGFLGDGADHHAIEQAVGVMLARFSALPFGQIRNIDEHEVMGDVGAVLYEQPLRLPAQFAFFGRAVGILMGVTTALSPEFNVAEVAAPYAQQFARRGGVEGILSLFGVESVDALGRDMLRESISLAQSLARLPRRLDRVLNRVERGDLRVIIDSADLNPQFRARVSRRIATNILSRPLPAWVTLSIAGVFAVTLAAVRRGSQSHRADV